MKKYTTKVYDALQQGVSSTWIELNTKNYKIKQYENNIEI